MVRTSITMPVDIYKKALKAAKKDGFGTSFSAWLSKLAKEAASQ